MALLRLGDPADFIIVNNLTDFNAMKTYINGELVAENGKSYIQSVPEEPINHFDCDKISEEDVKDWGKSYSTCMTIFQLSKH